MKFRILAIVAVILLTAYAFPAQTEKGLDSKIAKQTFDKVWNTINDKFYDGNFNGVDWGRLRAQYEPQAASAKTENDLYTVINQMLGELKVSHVGVISPEILGKQTAPATTTGLGLRMIQGQIVVTRTLPDSSAARSEVAPGFVIKMIDNIEVKTVDEASSKLAGPAGSVAHVSYLDGKDQLKEVNLERVVLSETDRGELTKGLKIYALFESKRLENSVGYFRFSSFVKFLVPRIAGAIDSMRDSPGIIIDLRGNSGGDDEVSLKMAAMLFAKETQLMIIKRRRGDDYSFKTEPAKNPYLGHIVILVDELSGSASEEFAAGMQESGRAYIVGKTTMGEDLDADVVKLPTGAYLLYPFGQSRTPKGVIIEGRGVIPDNKVELTRSALLAGHDAQLEAAIEYIKEKNRMVNH